MPERMMWVRWDDGADLSKSQKSPGDYSPLTRDAKKRLGHVVLSDIDDLDVPGAEPAYSYVDPEHSSTEAHRSTSFSDAMAEVAAEVIGEFLDAAIEAAKPQVARWWNDQARPAIRSAAQSTRNRFRRADARGTSDAGFVPSEEASTKEGSQELPAGGDGRGAVMTTLDAEQRLTAALVARAFSDGQVRMVLNARVVDDEGQEVQLSLQEGSREEIEVQVNRLLAANPSMLARLIAVFADAEQGSEPILPRPHSPDDRNAAKLRQERTDVGE